MRQFKGSTGSIFAVGEPYRFHNIPLQDCGDGWDWRAPEGLGYWLPEDLSFEVFERGEWHSVGSVDVYHRSGRVAFDRNLGGMGVRASGVCHPTTLLWRGGDWRLVVNIAVRDRTVLGDTAVTTAARTVGSTAFISGEPQEPIKGEVLVWLHTSGQGVLVGVGEASTSPSGVNVKLNEEGVSFGYC